MTDHTLFTFPTTKVFASGKIIICEMWVDWLADEWIANIKFNVCNCMAWISQVLSRSIPHNILQLFPRQWLNSQFSPRLYKTTMRQFKGLQQ